MTVTNLVLKVQIVLERQANTGGIATLDYLCWKRDKIWALSGQFLFARASEQGPGWVIPPRCWQQISQCGFTRKKKKLKIRARNFQGFSLQRSRTCKGKSSRSSGLAAGNLSNRRFHFRRRPQRSAELGRNTRCPLVLSNTNCADKF